MRKQLNRLWHDLDHARPEPSHVPLGRAEAEAPAHTASSEPKRTSSGVTVGPPTFYGKIVEFQDFKRLFLDVMSNQTQLAESEKNAVLLKCMGTAETREQARLAIKQTSTFLDAVARLSRRYENGRDVVAFHWTEILKMRKMHINHEDVQYLLKLCNDHVTGIEAANCMTSSQLIAAFMDGQFHDDLRMGWRTRTAHLTEPPNIDHLREYLEELANIVSPAVVSGGTSHDKHQSRKRRQSPRQRSPQRRDSTESPPPKSEPPTPQKQVFQTNKGKKCLFCRGAHSVFGCSDFKAKTVPERQAWIRESKRCFNCMGEKHMASECKSTKKCQECGGLHHSLLHVSKGDKSKPDTPQVEGNVCVTQVMGTSSAAPVTAFIPISAGKHARYGRVMLDSGAEVSVISRKFANSLYAKPLRRLSVLLGGMGTRPSPYAVSLLVHGEEAMGRQGDAIAVEARVVDELPQPTSQECLKEFMNDPFLDGCPLADPKYEPGSRVDVILDNKSWYFCRTGESRKGPQPGLIADETLFGWVLGGSN